MNNNILNDFQYVVLVIKDHLASLPESSKIAVTNAVSRSLQEVEGFIRNELERQENAAQGDSEDSTKPLVE